MNGTVPRHMSLVVIAEPATTDPGIIEGEETVLVQLELSVAVNERIHAMAAACRVETEAVYSQGLSLFHEAFKAKSSGKGYIAIVDRDTNAIDPLLIPEFMALERLHNSQ